MTGSEPALSLTETVLGPVLTSDLGATLMHEHVLLVTAEIAQNYPERSWLGQKQDRLDEAVGKLRALKKRGIDTIVDLTVLGLGRRIPDVQSINAQVDINVIAATGLYTFDELPTFLASRRPKSDAAGVSVDVMVDMFIDDIVGGIADTGVRAGVLKCCTEKQGVTPSIDRVLRAVARAHRATGVPISTHTNAWHFTGLDQQRVFSEEGVDLERTVIGHCGDSTDLDYLRELMDRGSTIGMDRFGIRFRGMPTLAERVDTVVRLCELGYADRMVLSHDACCHMDTHAGLQTRFPEWNYNHISDTVLPALLERGVDQQQVEQMMVGNPRTIFEKQGAY